MPGRLLGQLGGATGAGEGGGVGQERQGWGRRGGGGAGEGTGPKRSKALGCWGTPILLGHWALGWHPCPPGAEFCGRQTTTGK